MSPEVVWISAKAGSEEELEMTDKPRRMLLNAFTMNCVSHLQQGLWVRDESRQVEYASLDPWLDLAQICEAGCFDAIFLADVTGVYDIYKGSGDTSFREGMQVPVNDPMLLVPAMATVTENLGFAFTSSIYQAHPFTFARQLSTLDHLTNGRVGWNVVTSYLPNSAASLGYESLPKHDDRYDRADEYMEVVYKLWEASWEDGAALADQARGVYTDPSKVHPIDHHGKYYDVAGPHLSEPSRQRTPMIFQAGSSERGREFAARHAEGVFLVAPTSALSSITKDIRQRAVRHGRQPDDLRFVQGLSPVVGGTEAEAKAKAADYREQLSVDGGLSHLSGGLGIDLGNIDPDRPLEEFISEGVLGGVKALIDSAPPGTRTFGDLVKSNMTGQFLVGSVEQVADTLQSRFEQGVDGFNLVYSVTPGTFVDFIDGVVPILRERGLAQSEYQPGSLRNKLFGQDLLPDRHPAGAYRQGSSV